MANIVVFSADTTSNAPVNTKAALQAGGHTVTLVADSAIGATSVASYDCMVAVRCNNSTTVASALKAKVQAGKPLAIALVEVGITAGTGKTTNPTSMNYVGTCELEGNTAGTGINLNVIDVSHPITAFAMATGNLPVLSSANWKGAVDTGQSFIGTRLGNGPTGDATAGQPQLLAIEAGTSDLGAVATGARVVVWGNIYANQSTYADATMLHRIVEWLTGLPRRIILPSAGSYSIQHVKGTSTNADGLAIVSPTSETLTTTAVTGAGQTFTRSFPAGELVLSLLPSGSLGSIRYFLDSGAYATITAVTGGWDINWEDTNYPVGDGDRDDAFTYIRRVGGPLTVGWMSLN